MFGLARNLCRHVRRRMRRAPRRFTLVLIGLDDAGKTTVLAAIKGDPTDDAQPTWGFSTDTTDTPHGTVTFYDLGGGKRIRRIWEEYYAEVHGVVFVADAAAEDRLGEARDALKGALSHVSPSESSVRRESLAMRVISFL